jgi:hypothetical protein
MEHERNCTLQGVFFHLEITIRPKAGLDATRATCYPNRMTPFANTPDRFSPAELQRFEDLVIKGCEVGGNVLTANIRRAGVGTNTRRANRLPSAPVAGEARARRSAVALVLQTG